MHNQRLIEVVVGIFIIIAILCLIFLAFKVSGLTSYSYSNAYTVSADFQNIGDLKPRAPVTVAGVRVGEITAISLDDASYTAKVTMRIDSTDKIPVDSTANIYTAGLIGSNYISITPGFSEEYLKDGGQITRTNQAMILQNVIGQLLFSLKSGDSKSQSSGDDAETQAAPAPAGG